QHGHVIAARLPDYSDKAIVRKWWDCYVQCYHVRIEFPIGGACHHLAHTGSTDQRSRYRCTDLLCTYEASLQVRAIDRDAHDGNELIAHRLQAEISRSRVYIRRRQ